LQSVRAWELAQRIVITKIAAADVLAFSEATRGQSAQDMRTMRAKMHLAVLVIDRKREIRISVDPRRRIALNAELFSARYSN
jgi:hypothetical protein